MLQAAKWTALAQNYENVLQTQCTAAGLLKNPEAVDEAVESVAAADQFLDGCTSTSARAYGLSFKRAAELRVPCGKMDLLKQQNQSDHSQPKRARVLSELSKLDDALDHRLTVFCSELFS